MKQKEIGWKNILALQLIVCVFSLVSVAAKFASEQVTFSKGFFLFYALELVLLGVYALLWQQAIKKFDISIAYANKAMVLVWGMLWSIVIFHDGITAKQLLGVVLVVAGVMILNRDAGGEQDAK